MGTPSRAHVTWRGSGTESQVVVNGPKDAKPVTAYLIIGYRLSASAHPPASANGASNPQLCAQLRED
ncbi:uncharacterized protein PG998_007753 [Apiospora kogelbergensis]|uniref:Uncharacterized protein n=1 Tax=Apiospora kogelbergensis TaxID=1337665 RepID=A0AAW0QST3_9PEZI